MASLQELESIIGELSPSEKAQVLQWVVGKPALYEQGFLFGCLYSHDDWA